MRHVINAERKRTPFLKKERKKKKQAMEIRDVFGLLPPDDFTTGRTKGIMMGLKYQVW